MINRLTENRGEGNGFIALAILASAFTALNVVYSTHYGRLAVPPTYDDIGFISNGLAMLESGYEKGLGRWLLDFFTKTWHSPVAALQACIAFAVFGKAVWAPYLLNGLYLIALFICLRRELARFPISTVLVVAVSVLAWPLTGYLIVEFRPDIATNLFLALGTWRLANRHEAIGQASCRGMPMIWEVTWPFGVALWLKPSFSPVTIGLWVAAWAVLCIVNHLTFKKEGGLRNTLSAFVRGTLVLCCLFAPYLAVSGGHLARYFITNIFSSSQEIWSPPLSTSDNLKYYIVGEGGLTTMRWWSLITVAVALFAAPVAIRSRNYSSLRKGGIYLAFTIIAWVGMTALKNKSPWFGSVVSSHFMVLFAVASVYLMSQVPRASIAYRSFAVLLVLCAVELHAWPNLSGVLPGVSLREIPAYAREAKRVYADACKAVENYSGGARVVVLMPAISLMLNPDLIELCALEGSTTTAEVSRIYMRPFDQVSADLRSAAFSGDNNMLAFILSPDFPGIPGNMPTSKRIGSINRYFSTSSNFKLVDTILGPNGTGRIRLYKRLAGFSPLENVVGMKEMEGPYPDKKLPSVRWTLFPRAEFDTRAVPGHRTKVAIAGMPALPRISATIRLSSGERQNCEFAAGVFAECRIEFVAKSDRIHVAIEARDPTSAAATPRSGEAILLSELQVTDIERLPSAAASHTESPFANIDLLDGFGNIEGPYKKWNLPVVVWGKGGFSRVGIAEGGPGTFAIEWRPGESVQAIEVLQKETLIGRCTADSASPDFKRCEVSLPLPAVPGEVVLRYIGDSKKLSNKLNNSALFRQIQFIEKE